MSRISIVDLEVFYHVGVSEQERAQPQRLLVTIDMTADLTVAAMSDRIEKTIDYFEVSREVLRYGEGKSWKLLERLGSDLADMVLSKFHPAEVAVEIKKFVIPQARYVSVSLAKGRH